MLKLILKLKIIHITLDKFLRVSWTVWICLNISEHRIKFPQCSQMTACVVFSFLLYDIIEKMKHAKFSSLENIFSFFSMNFNYFDHFAKVIIQFWFCSVLLNCLTFYLMANNLKYFLFCMIHFNYFFWIKMADLIKD